MLEKFKKIFKKYSVHIFVEIFIIVFGVLIALQVNNWNESRKERKHLKGILGKVINDWERDTLLINQYKKYYDPFLDAYDKVIQKAVTDEYLDTCKVCRGLIISYFPFKTQSNGVQLLKQYVNFSSSKIQSDTFIINLVQTQLGIDEVINQMATRIKNDVDNNLNVITEKEWFGDFVSQKEMPQKFKQYYKSTTFRNKTIRHKIFVKRNLIQTINQYKKRIIKDLPKLKKKYNNL